VPNRAASFRRVSHPRLPKGPKTTTWAERDVSFQLRLTEEEREMLDRVASRAGFSSVSEYLRYVIRREDETASASSE
jgi:hypothetical protein